VTVVIGTSDYNKAAAERLAKILAPWDVRCKVVNGADVNKPRELTEDEKPTWCGNSGDAPAPTGFAIQGPTILLGTPEDNPLIAYTFRGFQPYRTLKDVFPGRGQGLYSWQRDAIGKGQESITLIAYDAEGMGQAVGSLYQAVHGLDPLTRWELPRHNAIAAAKEANPVGQAKVSWRALAPDRVDGLKADGQSLQVLSHDGSLVSLNARGEATGGKVLRTAEIAEATRTLATAKPTADGAKTYAMPARVAKFVVTLGDRTAVGYWGGALRIYEGNTVKTQQQLPQDITAMVAADARLVVGLADGQVLALESK
jgi:hypothetical protein